MCFRRGFPPVLKADRKDMYENIINRETAGDRRETERGRDRHHRD